MDADRWKRVEDCYHSALERPFDRRAQFLAQACAHDPELRREVESLLGHEGQADGLLESPAWNHVAPADETTTFAPGGSGSAGGLAASVLQAGSLMAEYRVAGKLGSGGMGEVYRATDTKLQREVALKVLTPAFAHDSEWLSRFQREARVLASLNHPHIAAIYGLEESSGICAIVMELVEGPTLADRLSRAQIPIPEALTIARQIAEGLEYAHEKGVVHRDLKPANVKLRPDGAVKVLDFGLAKPAPSDGGLSMSATRAGMIVGTPAYMSPEQAAGIPVDRRSDIWAFGVVLFEMLTGQQIYARKSTLETLAAVARDDAQWDQLPAETPAAIIHLLHRCLDRNPKRRLRDIGEARIVLEGGQPEEPVKRVHSRAEWIAAGLLGAALAVLAVLHFREEPPASSGPVLFQIHAPEKTVFNMNGNPAGPVAVSPDGRRMVFSAVGEGGKNQLWVRSLDALAPQALPGTEGATDPFWSPDGRFLGFFADKKLKKIDSTGGTPTILCDARYGRGGTWNREGVIVFAPDSVGPLLRVSANGGPASPVTKLDTTRREADHRWPWFLPDGHQFLFTTRVGLTGAGSIRVASLDGGDSQILVETSANAAFAMGYLLYLRGTNLVAQPFDVRNRAFTGDPVPVADRVLLPVEFTSRGVWGVSENGILAYQSGEPQNWELDWFDASGQVTPFTSDPGYLHVLHLSPDGKTAAISITDRSTHNEDIWLYDFARTFKTRFTTDPAEETAAVWSPDGASIVFDSNRRGHSDLYRKPADGGHAEELLYEDSLDKLPTSWSPDGGFLLYYDGKPWVPGHLWVLPMTGERKPHRFDSSEFPEADGQFSRTDGGSPTNPRNRGIPRSTSPRFQGPAASARSPRLAAGIPGGGGTGRRSITSVRVN